MQHESFFYFIIKWYLQTVQLAKPFQHRKMSSEEKNEVIKYSKVNKDMLLRYWKYSLFNIVDRYQQDVLKLTDVEKITLVDLVDIWKNCSCISYQDVNKLTFEIYASITKLEVTFNLENKYWNTLWIPLNVMSCEYQNAAIEQIRLEQERLKKAKKKKEEDKETSRDKKEDNQAQETFESVFISEVDFKMM